MELKAEGACTLACQLRLWTFPSESEAKFCVHHCVCEQALVCSSVKWDNITCLPELQSLARA